MVAYILLLVFATSLFSEGHLQLIEFKCMPSNSRRIREPPRLSCSEGQVITATKESYHVNFKINEGGTSDRESLNSDREEENECTLSINTLRICIQTTTTNSINMNLMTTLFFIEDGNQDRFTDVELTFSEDTVCPNNTNMYCARYQFESLEIDDDVEGIGVTFMINFIRRLVSSSNIQNFLQLQLFINSMESTSVDTTSGNPVSARTASISDTSTLSSSEIPTALTSDITSGVIGGQMSPPIEIVAGSISVLLVLIVIIVILVAALLFVSKKKKKQTYSTNNHQKDTGISQEEAEYADIGPKVCRRSNTPLDDNSGCATIVPTASPYEVPEPSKASQILDEDIYTAPSFNEESLYAQLEKNNASQNFFRDSIQLGQTLGSGQFGEVYSGIWLDSHDKVEVAVKTLKKEAEEEDKVRFLQEAAIMSQFNHPNVVTMYGVVTDGEPTLIILELLAKGDLRSHLVRAACGTSELAKLDDHTLLSYCRQIACGMTYLSSKAFVHRDLAARNILVSDDEVCKIADFGMSRDLMYESYYVSHGGMIPVKWTAPEALHYKRYSSASDVWSYGAVMYEIWSVGHKPFEDVENNKVMALINEGYRLPPPPGCPRAMYNIMMECWHLDSSKRPTFTILSRQLSLPDSRLLIWSGADKSLNTHAARLGEKLEVSRELYLDIQNKYKNTN